ncbi:VWA domain-containing protein [Vibrio amylolyticus]|uniref:VWA domain-containing protein n=1 Tax=Vibrio amylolyticus TaxID=2847292 RepID=UPI003551D89B
MSSFTFLYPFWLLALVPTIGLIVWLSKNNQHASLVAPHLAKAIGLESMPRRKGFIYFIGASLICAVIALSGPSFYSSERPVYGNSGGRVVVMDMSFSMYTTDIKPNRLTQARYKVTDLLNAWQEGNTGLVAYAGDAYTVSPMTTDNQTLLNLLPNLSPDIMPYPGADAAAGVQLAIETMTNSGLNQGDVILVADDIDDAEKNAIRDLLENTQWRLTLLAVATPSGAPIRLSDGTLLRDNNGTTVIAQSNFSNMKSLARSQDGLFTAVQADSKDVELITAYTTQIVTDAESMQQQKLEERVNSGFWLLPFLLIPAVMLFRRGVIFSVATLSFVLLQPNYASASANENPNASTSVKASPWQTSDQHAKALYDAQEYQQAADAFTNKEWQGVAHYQAGNFQAAIDSLEGVEGERAQYNRANAQAQNGDFEQAISNYTKLIEQGHYVKEATENLAIVKQAQQQQQQQQQDDGDAQSGEDNSESKESDSEDNSQSSDAQDQNTESSDSNPSQDNSDSNENSEASSNQSDEQNSTDSSKEDKESTESPSPEDQESASEQDQTSKQAQQEQTERDNTEDHDANSQSDSVTTTQDSQNQVDPDIRKLEQVENARDPSRLLQAQMLLQAKQKQPPQNTGKKW